MSVMNIDRFERVVRKAGAIGTLALVVMVVAGYLRGIRQPAGRRSGNAPPVMRSLRFFVPSSIFGVALSYRLWRPAPITLNPTGRIVALLAGAPLFFGGLALMMWGRLTLGENYDISSMFGAELHGEHRLVTSGPFARVRHPMYVGGILWAVGMALIYRTWLAVIIGLFLPPDLLVRARREEEALAAEFGETWDSYSQRTPAFLPRFVGWRGG